MLTKILILLITLFMPAIALAQPQIAFDNEAYDFGIVRENLILEHVFEVRNDGNEDLIIRKIETP